MKNWRGRRAIENLVSISKTRGYKAKLVLGFFLQPPPFSSCFTYATHQNITNIQFIVFEKKRFFEILLLHSAPKIGFFWNKLNVCNILIAIEWVSPEAAKKYNKKSQDRDIINTKLKTLHSFAYFRAHCDCYISEQHSGTGVAGNKQRLRWWDYA